MDSSALADRDCLVAFAAVVLCSDRGVQAHKMGYDYGGIAHLTAKGAAGRTGLSKAAAGRALRRLEEAGLIISDEDGDAWRPVPHGICPTACWATASLGHASANARTSMRFAREKPPRPGNTHCPESARER